MHHVHHVRLRFASLIVHLRRYLVDHGQEVGMDAKQWYRRCYCHSAVNDVKLDFLHQMQQDSVGWLIRNIEDN
jgi:hypothetical protein